MLDLKRVSRADILKRVLSWVFATVAAVIVAQAASVLTITFLPDSPVGQWLAANDPLFRFLLTTPLRSEQEPTEEEPKPRRPRTVIRVPGQLYVYLGPGLNIYATPDFRSP